MKIQSVLVNVGRGMVVANVLIVAAVYPERVGANPAGATVTQGSMSMTSSGSQLTINQTSANALINWQSFNIAPGETTTFIQPSSSSVAWNQINDANPSQILGSLNANGYVVLQNPNGFHVGGQASISAHGLVMTTAPTTAPDLAGGGAWSFNLPPPAASIVNYGRINVGSGSAFLIAQDVENHGTISAPSGNIGLYAGQQVLVSTRPDGRGLSAQVTLPQGSVNNQGQLIADGGGILLEAQVVNQGGLLQANSVLNVNGSIELVASDAINLGASSTISARGDGQGVSPGGNVTIKSANTYSDQAGSTIDISGGAQGGNGGQLEISADNLNAIQSSIAGRSASGFSGGSLTIDPVNLNLTSAFVQSLTPTLSGGIYSINLQADNDITVSTSWSLTYPGYAATLNLTAGNSIIFNNGSAIKAVLTDSSGNAVAQNNWNINLVAGTELTSASARQSGSDGIYLLGNSSIQTQNGNIGLTAANEIIVNAGNDIGNNGNPIYVTLPNGTTVDALSSGAVGGGTVWNGVRTLKGGSITATAQYGDINTGGNYNGYTFGQNAAPYYRVNAGSLGGMSTAAGGNVTITAGGDVISYLPMQSTYSQAQYDGGTGAFGANPGNVTITAGGNISGNFVLANGTGTVTSQNGDVGSQTPNLGFALSLIRGGWCVYAPNGNIYLQDARNPNGIFNDKSGTGYAGYHYFDYDPMASLLLDAGDSVEITGAGAPHTAPSIPFSAPIPLIFPPTLQVMTGSGGFILDQNVTLFPSPDGDLHITTQNHGDFNGNGYYLQMSDSAARQYDPNATIPTFSINDDAGAPPELNNTDPVTISVAGDLDNITLYTTKATTLTVGGNAFNANFVGENLHASDVTSVNVAGSISYSPAYVFASLPNAISSADPLVSASWDTIFSLLVSPSAVASFALNGNESASTLDSDAASLTVFNKANAAFAYTPSANPGFIYDPSTLQLAFHGQMSSSVLSALTGTLAIIKVNASTGLPVLQPGNAALGQDPSKFYFATATVNFAPASVIQELYNASQTSAIAGNAPAPGFQIGGPGQFNITAASVDLGSSLGIISWGVGFGTSSPKDYSNLTAYTPSEGGAAINLDTSGNISMLTSTIASIYGGNLSVNCGGQLDLSQGSFNLPVPNGYPCFGIYTSGHSDLSVVAKDDINVGSSRIATFNGGNILVESLDGDVNAGNGANSALVVPVIYEDPTTGLLVAGQIGGTMDNPRPYGSGILAIAPTPGYSWDHESVPGNITVDTPQGNINSTLGGIEQFALNGSVAAGPTINLTAGTPGGFAGNVNLGQGGVIGGTVNVSAQGSVSGLIVSRQNSTITAVQNVDATVLSGGTANVSASGTIGGTVIGIAGVSASGGGGITASLLGQSVSANGGAAQSTLGTTAAATSTSQAAAQQASSDTKQQVAQDTTTGTDDDQKKKGKHQVITRQSRVTVILPPKAS